KRRVGLGLDACRHKVAGSGVRGTKYFEHVADLNTGSSIGKSFVENRGICYINGLAKNYKQPRGGVDGIHRTNDAAAKVDVPRMSVRPCGIDGYCVSVNLGQHPQLQV